MHFSLSVVKSRPTFKMDYKEYEKNNMSILRRNFVPDQGRKTSLSGLREAFSGEEMGQKAKQKGITYFLSVPKA